MTAPANSSGLLQVDNDGGGGVILIAPFTFTAGRTAVLTLGHFATGQSISSVTIGGTAAVLDSSIDKFQSTDSSGRIYRAVDMAGGTDEIVIVYSGGTDNYISCSVEEWDYVLTPNAGTPNSAEAFSISPSVSTANPTTVANTIVYGLVVPGEVAAAQGLDGPAGWTPVWTEQDNSSHQSGRGAWIEETTTGTKTAAFTRSASNPWGAAIVAYEISPITPASSLPPKIHHLKQQGFQ